MISLGQCVRTGFNEIILLVLLQLVCACVLVIRVQAREASFGAKFAVSVLGASLLVTHSTP